MAGETTRGVPLSTLCPKFLHTNSTSHTWPFSAIAELIDNAYDPDVSAKQFWIDKTVVQGQECLTFMDNGNGLDYEIMHKMLSFGYSDKTTINGLEPIGIYGNGFKSGSMRLGKDAIVFSKSKGTSCVGMLSQTYLEKISAKQIIVPIVCFEQRAANKHSVREEHKASLRDILCYSPFKTQEELLVEIEAITSSGSTGTTGSRIIIWNLRSTSTGTTEFDFEKDRYDIRIPSDVYETMDGSSHNQGITSHRPESDYSLRAYTSILYLKPRMQIIIRGQKVKSQLIAKSLAFIRKDFYKPVSQNKRIPITFGYNTKSKDQCGIMMYHKNRLIKAYERVACQLKVDIKGDGVIGVIECNYLDPTHNKQSFIETDKYRKTMNSLGIKLEEYWNEIRHKRIKENPNSLPVEDTVKRPDQNWAQCDDCQKWRKLPDGIDCSKLPGEWFCRLNPDPQFRSCLVEEEREDSDDEQQAYRKTYKQQEREKKKNQEKKRQMEEAQKRQEAQRVAELTRQNQALKQQLHQKPPHFPTTPATQRNGVNTESAARAESLPFSQAACRPSSSSGLPVISNVCSLSTGIQRGKRARPASPQRTPKTPKANRFHLAASDTSPFSNASPLSSPSVVVSDSPDDSDDDIVILETSSTPKPQNPSFHLSKVKTERTEGSDDDDALDVSLRQNAAGRDSTGSAAAGASPSITTQVEMTSTPTQTERPKVKTEEEEEALNETEGTRSRTKSIGRDIDFSLEQQGIPNRARPSYMAEIQNQPDQLVELMQERDSYKEQVGKLTAQLRDAQSKLQELFRVTVKEECSHQAGQMQEAEGGEHCKTLSKTQTGNKSIKDEEASPASAKAEDKVEDTVIDEIALQVDHLMRELDQRNKERVELLSQVQSLKEENVSLASQCEELRMTLQQQRENTPGRFATPN